MAAIVIITGLEGADAVLAARLLRLENKQPAMKQIGEALLLSTDDRFVSESGPDGQPWKPLSPTTLAARARRYRGKTTKRAKGGGTTETAGFGRFMGAKRILQEQGTRGGLRSSLTYRATRDSVTVGSNKVYAAIQQFGGEAGRGGKVTIPARPYVGVSTGDMGTIRGILTRWVGEQIGAAE